MNATPRISVIIPVYNAEPFLPQALDSVLNQSLNEIEVICVDDGSTDRSLSILQDYAKKDSRVKVLHQQNLHAGIARNAGLEVATGEYIHFLDADDYVLDYAYEAIYNKAVKYDLDCLKFSCIPFDVQQDTTVENSAYTLTHFRPFDFNRLLTPEANSVLYKLNAAPWSGIYRRSFLEEKQIRFDDLVCGNDRSFSARIFSNAGRIMAARDQLVVHRLNRPGDLTSRRAGHFDGQLRSIRIVEQNLIQDQIPTEVARTIMSGEFADLCMWLEKLGFDPKYGEQIVMHTRQFAKEYDGMFRRALIDLVRARTNRMAAGPQKAKPLTKKIFFREECTAPKVSVVLPIYNVEDYLNQALHSLSVQTLAEMEFLCVNDGSTDGSLTIMKEYAAKDKRFRILDGPNGGYGKAMNRGIDAARGEYLGILEPDDFADMEMFQTLYETASKNRLDLVKSDFYTFTVSPEGLEQKKTVRLAYDKRFYGRVIDPKKEKEIFYFPMNTWTGIYNLNFLRKNDIRHNETPGASYQDNGFFFKSFCCAKRLWFVNTAFYMYRQDNPNSSMLSKGKLYCATEELRLIWEWLDKRPDLQKEFAPQFYRKKFASFMVTYRRIPDAQRLEYLYHIRDEFKPVLEAGLLTEEAFPRVPGGINWQMLNEMVADPDAYFARIRVSVIMPVYNAEQYLRQCLDSVLNRAEQRIEVICVDDGSTDSSPEILREYAEKDARVTVITQENAGAGAARNNGMAFAKGEYLSFLDADDFFEPDMLSSAYNRAHYYDSDIVVFRSDLYSQAEKRYYGASHTIRANYLPQEQPFAGSDIEENVFGVFAGWAWDKLFKTEFVRRLGLKFQEQRTTNDMLFVFSAIVQAQSICTINGVLAHHRSGAGSLSVTREKSWDCFYKALLALRQQLKDWGLYERFESDFVNYSLHFALWNLTTLRGPSYALLYNKLHDEWFQELGVAGRDEACFYSLEEYNKLQSILTLTAEEFLFSELDEAKAKNSGLQSEVNRLRNINRDTRNKAAELRKKNAKLRKQRKSASWKIGRIITWLPRKLKKLLRKH